MALASVVLTATAQKERFCIARDGKAATIVVDGDDWTGVKRAAGDLADDVRKVTGVAAGIRFDYSAGGHSQNLILVGTIGKSRLIDKLVEQKKIDVSKVKGQWEAYLIDIVDVPSSASAASSSPLTKALVIAGSDRRGTIYGIYEISRSMGVSPWYWWADVPVEHHDEVWYDGGRTVQPSPSVKYRGIFINDEDWGLKPWASNNYERNLGDIGPKTYARVCELLLRLKANMLAPAMHSCTGAFYSHPESKVVCDSFGIIITTSHCEPLLLNNAAESEWNQERDGDWNYKTNRETIVKKWDDRLSEAAQYENIYTTAMRGVHDAGLRGNLPMEERVPLIEQVIREQRELLVKHDAYTPLASEPTPTLGGRGAETSIPQIFVPYKETMDIYEHGLRVPDDITLVWVDDNYGYMKRVSNPEEQKRSGRAGVYYHLSYLGAPHDYLWLNTTPPVLMYEELKKAYDNGADRYWLLNVGDIKPMEMGIQTFMDMAYDFGSFDFENANSHQAEFLSQIFGPSHLSSILSTYYRLAWIRKPEFMGWEYQWDDAAHTGLKDTDFSFKNNDEAQHRLADYQRISDEVEAIGRQFSSPSSPNSLKDSWFQLVQFPVQAAYQMNRKFLMAQLNHEMAAEGRFAEANWAARQMEAAYDSINALNSRYNEQLDGKWRGMMALATSFTNTCMFYQKPQVTYTEGVGEQPVDLVPHGSTVTSVPSLLPLSSPLRPSDGVRMVRGLGYDDVVLQLNGGEVSYTLPASERDTVGVVLYTVPFWPLYEGKSNRVGVSIDGGDMQVFENRFKEYDRTWKDQVMCNGAVCHLRFALDKSKTSHTITLHTIDPGQMVQRVMIE